MTDPVIELDLLLVQKLNETSDLEARGAYREAILLLEQFGQEYSRRPGGEWLVEAVKLHQATILWQAGNLAESLEKYRTLKYSPDQRFSFLLKSYCIARNLRDLGRLEEAFQEVEYGLKHVSGPPESSDLVNVRLYAELAEKVERQLPRWYSDLARQVLAKWGILEDTYSLDTELAIKSALQRADEKARRLPDRYRGDKK